MCQASQGDNNSLGALQSLLKRLPIGGSDYDRMGEADGMQAEAKAYHFDPNNSAPPEVRERLWKLLNWRDNVYRDIIKKIEMVPGLSDLIENLTTMLNTCTSWGWLGLCACIHVTDRTSCAIVVYTVLAPYTTVRIFTNTAHCRWFFIYFA